MDRMMTDINKGIDSGDQHLMDIFEKSLQGDFKGPSCVPAKKYEEPSSEPSTRET